MNEKEYMERAVRLAQKISEKANRENRAGKMEIVLHHTEMAIGDFIDALKIIQEQFRNAHPEDLDAINHALNGLAMVSANLDKAGESTFGLVVSVFGKDALTETGELPKEVVELFVNALIKAEERFRREEDEEVIKASYSEGRDIFRLCFEDSGEVRCSLSPEVEIKKGDRIRIFAMNGGKMDLIVDGAHPTGDEHSGVVLEVRGRRVDGSA